MGRENRMRHIFCVFCALLAAFCPLAARAADAPDTSGWVVMPAGTRATFMGIHGGTMPVSLLVAEDGSALVSFVGRTGNDFLEVLRRTDIPMPSLLNATARRPANTSGTLPDSGRPALTAGTSDSSMPVFNLSGNNDPTHAMLPFGLSDKPLSIEGQAIRPQDLSPAKNYRFFFQPQYLQPRRAPR